MFYVTFTGATAAASLALAAPGGAFSSFSNSFTKTDWRNSMSAVTLSITSPATFTKTQMNR